MSELIHHKPDEVVKFMEEIGYPVPREEIQQVYPIHFPERRVLRVSGLHPEADMVLKVRPLDQNRDALEEQKKLQLLFNSYRYAGCVFPAVEAIILKETGYVVFKMSYLGPNLGELGVAMDLDMLGYPPENEIEFEGFSQDHALSLLDQMERAHREFTRDHGLLHGDMAQNGTPNNIVYYKPFEQLFLVDAEALTPATDKGFTRFNEQMEAVRAWVLRSLIS